MRRSGLRWNVEPFACVVDGRQRHSLVTRSGRSLHTCRLDLCGRVGCCFRWTSWVNSLHARELAHGECINQPFRNESTRRGRSPCLACKRSKATGKALQGTCCRPLLWTVILLAFSVRLFLTANRLPVSLRHMRPLGKKEPHGHHVPLLSPASGRLRPSDHPLASPWLPRQRLAACPAWLACPESGSSSHHSGLDVSGPGSAGEQDELVFECGLLPQSQHVVPPPTGHRQRRRTRPRPPREGCKDQVVVRDLSGAITSPRRADRTGVVRRSASSATSSGWRTSPLSSRKRS